MHGVPGRNTVALAVKDLARNTVVVVAVVAAAAGCGSASSSRKPGRGSHSGLPNPLTITTLHGATSLGLTEPHSLAVGPDGNVYLADYHQRVSVIAPSGKVVRRFGSRGSGPGQFHFIATDPSDPKGVEAKVAVGPDGVVYVSDSGNGRVEAFSPRGRFLRQFGSFGHGNGQFVLPFDVAVDGNGDVYVVDDQALTLTKLSKTGRQLWRLRDGSSTARDIQGHMHLETIDSHGRLVVVSEENGKVVYVDAGGHEVDSFSANAASMRQKHTPICEASVDTLGNTYVTGCAPGPTLVFDRTHRLVGEWPGRSHPFFDSPAFGPHGEAFTLGFDGALIALKVAPPGR
jgi:tripartite motif-containing protein 71